MKFRIGSKKGKPLNRALNPLIVAGAGLVLVVLAATIVLIGALFIITAPFSIFTTITRVKEYT